MCDTASLQRKYILTSADRVSSGQFMKLMFLMSSDGLHSTWLSVSDTGSHSESRRFMSKSTRRLPRFRCRPWEKHKDGNICTTTRDVFTAASGLSTWLASSSSTSSYSEILQSTTSLSAGSKDQLPIQGIQYHGTSCLEVSCLQLQNVSLPSPLSRHIWKLNCLQPHTTRSNISSAAGASDSNSRHGAANVFDIDTDNVISAFLVDYIYFVAIIPQVHSTACPNNMLRTS